MIGSARRYVKNSSCVCGTSCASLVQISVMKGQYASHAASVLRRCIRAMEKATGREMVVSTFQRLAAKNENSHLPSPQIICTPKRSSCSTLAFDNHLFANENLDQTVNQHLLEKVILPLVLKQETYFPRPKGQGTYCPSLVLLVRHSTSVVDA